MAKFRFALQRVLDRRLDEEEARRRVLSQVEAKRRGLEDALRTRQQEISAGRDAWRSGLVGTVDPAALRHHAIASTGLVRKAQRTVLELAGMEKALVKARADLVEAARARRALEILRERRLAAHLAEESRRERDNLDEFAANVARRARDAEGAAA
ncbi:MAG: flagellar export protein FliJ [Planctomycetaceae bacterium]|jgi:flagellar FliJ protein|nr:flagellar export protein FliJ [Planctomycetaceae bacterium]